MKTEVILIIDNVRSAYNVGSMFRTCEGAGIVRIILAGYTPSPTDRFGRNQPEIAKTSLGASTMVPFEAIKDTQEILDEITNLKVAGFSVVL